LKKILTLIFVGLLVFGFSLNLAAQTAAPKAAEPAAAPKAAEPAAAPKAAAPKAAEPAAAPKAAAEPALPKDKETVLKLYVTAKEAYGMLQKDPAVKLLDCRTPEEYAFVGHPAMAKNIPSKFMTYKWDEKKKGYAMKDNPRFAALVKKQFKPDEVILVMCRSGQRSAASVNKLAKAGYQKVYQITDGFEGDKVKDPQSPNVGKRAKNGWKNASLPWTYDLDQKLMYLAK